MNKKYLKICLCFILLFLCCEIRTSAAEYDAKEQVRAFFAVDEETAWEIAEFYQAELLSYQYGVGTLNIPEHISTWNIRKNGAQLYPELTYTVEFEDAEEQEQWHLDAIQMERIWSESKGDGVKVAVIDTGIDCDHPDLIDNILLAETVVPEEFYEEGARFEAEHKGPEDYLGHGTHVAGIIAASDDGNGCIGIAPECEIISIKALDKSGNKGVGKTSWIVAAIQYAIQQETDIINLSIGGTNISDNMLEQAIKQAVEKDVIVVCAAGNIAGIQQVFYPAAYDSTISVSALLKTEEGLSFASSYSNFGEWIDISAPGSGIVSTIPDGYGAKSGTSMACPMVSGVIADLLSYDRGLSGKEIYELLVESAEDLGTQGKDDQYGYGVLNPTGILELYHEKMVLNPPEPEYENGTKFSKDFPICICTKTLKAKVIYTLDGSEPNENSLVYPKEGLTFNIGNVHLKVKSLGADGELSETVCRNYEIVPDVTIVEEKAGILDYEYIPIGATNDPVLEVPAKRYKFNLEPNEKLSIEVSAEEFNAKVYLFDQPDESANVLKLLNKNGKYYYINRTADDKGVWLSIVDRNLTEIMEPMKFKLEWSIKEQKKAVKDEPVLIEVVNSQTSFQERETEQEVSVIVNDSYEENWLYTMEETETVTEFSNEKKDEKGNERITETLNENPNASDVDEKDESHERHSSNKIPLVAVSGAGLLLVLFILRKNKKTDTAEK